MIASSRLPLIVPFRSRSVTSCIVSEPPITYIPSKLFISNASKQHPIFFQNSHKPQLGSPSETNAPTIYQHPHQAISSQNPHIPQLRPSAHIHNTSTSHHPSPTPCSQNPQRHRPSPSTQNSRHTINRDPRPVASNQIFRNAQSGASAQDCAYVDNNTYQQSITYQETPAGNSSHVLC